MTMRRVLGSTRQDELLNYLRTFRTGHVAELSQILGASPSTIRRDLDELQERTGLAFPDAVLDSDVLKGSGDRRLRGLADIQHPRRGRSKR